MPRALLSFTTYVIDVLNLVHLVNWVLAILDNFTRKYFMEMKTPIKIQLVSQNLLQMLEKN